MIISVNNPVQATEIFSLIFFVLLLISVRPRQIKDWFSLRTTTELKGLAILMIVFSHIGYFLVNDHRFLWPLSIMAGIGVNLFLFLSGLGLTFSQLHKNLGVRQFYKHRLLKLFTPFWLVIAILFALDFVFLKINYSWPYVVQSFFGIFTHADLYKDVNSPLWYLTFILGYYLLFPLVFSKKRPWLSALILYLAGYLLIYWQPRFLDYVSYLYKVHILAFPLGVLAAWGISKLPKAEVLDKLSRGKTSFVYYVLILLLLFVFYYVNIHSGIGQSYSLEQIMSTVAVLAISLIFILKKIEFRFLYIFGLYSYEIYLFHWPLLYRYDILYFWLPAWLATTLYLVVFLALAYLIKKVLKFSEGYKRSSVVLDK